MNRANMNESSLHNLKNYFSEIKESTTIVNNGRSKIFLERTIVDYSHQHEIQMYQGYANVETTIKYFVNAPTTTNESYKLSMIINQYKYDILTKRYICKDYSWINKLNDILIVSIMIKRDKVFRDNGDNLQFIVCVRLNYNKKNYNIRMPVPEQYVVECLNQLCQHDTNIEVHVINVDKNKYNSNDNWYENILPQIKTQFLWCDSLILNDVNSERLFKMKLINCKVNGKLLLPNLQKLYIRNMTIAEFSQIMDNIINPNSSLNELVLLINRTMNVMSFVEILNKCKQITSLKLILNVTNERMSAITELISNNKSLTKLVIDNRLARSTNINVGKISNNYTYIWLINFNIKEKDMESIIKSQCTVQWSGCSLPMNNERLLEEYITKYDKNLNLAWMLSMFSQHNLHQKYFKYIINTLLLNVSLYQKCTFTIYSYHIEKYKAMIKKN